MIELLEAAPHQKLSKLKVLTGDAVLVRVLGNPTHTPGGLIIPDTAERNKPGYEGALAKHLFRGVVVACGPGKPDGEGVFRATTVQPGDHVFFAYMAEYCDSLRWPDDEHLIFPEGYVQAIYE